MSAPGQPVRDARAMIAAMEPALDPATYRFCTCADPARAAEAAARALATFREDEGLSLVLEVAEARDMGFPDGPAMRRITLTVHSALDGVGLTAAVSEALAARGIACNVVAAFHHDHLFVPEIHADEAMEALSALQRAARAGQPPPPRSASISGA